MELSIILLILVLYGWWSFESYIDIKKTVFLPSNVDFKWSTNLWMFTSAILVVAALIIIGIFVI